MNATVSQPEIRNQLLLRLAESRSVTDELFRVVREDALYDRPIPERHRIIFYIGHLEAFDWNLIASHALGLGAAHKELDRLGSQKSTLITCVSGKDSTTFSRDPRRLRRDLGNIPKK
jgi:hypothetical protein